MRGDVITIALSKGRILEEALPLLRCAGLAPAVDFAGTRQLIVPAAEKAVRFLIVRASDVPTYVQYGAADLGIAGRDVLGEHPDAPLYELIDLGIAVCRLSVAVPATCDYAALLTASSRVRVATKYLAAARNHFSAKGVQVELIKLYGSMELAPLVGLADAIVDLVSTGATLRANGLKEVEVIAPISSALIANQAAMKLKRSAIEPVVEAIFRASKERSLV